jgi:hypothetical protein
VSVTEEDIEKAFSDYLRAFNILAEKEDEIERMKTDLDDLKEGGAKYVAAQQSIHVFEHKMMQYQRDLRTAGIFIDRIKTLLQAEQIAKK